MWTANLEVVMRGCAAVTKHTCVGADGMPTPLGGGIEVANLSFLES